MKRSIEEFVPRKSVLDDVVVSRLPIIKARPHKLPSADAVAKYSVLLLGLEQESRNFIRSLGRELNVNVYVAPNVPQALRILSLRPDVGVVITSITGARANNVSALRVVKRARSDLAMLALVDKVYADTFLELVNEGLIFRCLQKPLDIRELTNAMAAGFKRHRMLKKAEALGDGYHTSNAEKEKVKRSA